MLAYAIRLHDNGIRGKDALHIACAVSAHCDVFVSTDDGLEKRADVVREVEILNPTDLLRRLDK